MTEVQQINHHEQQQADSKAGDQQDALRQLNGNTDAPLVVPGPMALLVNEAGAQGQKENIFPSLQEPHSNLKMN